MKHGITYFLLRLLFATFILFAGAKLFSFVLPLELAYIIGFTLAVVELFGPMLGGQHGVSLRLFARLTLPLIAWPLIALAMLFVTHDHYINLAVGAIAAALTGLFSARHGQGHDHARLAELIVATTVPCVALIECLTGGNRAAAAITCVAVAAGFVASKIALVWPDRLEKMMEVGAVVACAAGVATAIPIFI